METVKKKNMITKIVGATQCSIQQTIAKIVTIAVKPTCTCTCTLLWKVQVLSLSLYWKINIAVMWATQRGQ